MQRDSGVWREHTMPRGVPHLAVPEPDRGKACYLDSLRVAHCVPKREHIVFMGDSVTRYQWLALAQSLHQGVELSTTEFPSSVKEREWLNWMPFFRGTHQRLSPNEHCDCYREYAKPVGSKSIENRYFWRDIIGADGGTIGSINLTFINVLDKYAPLMGHWAPWAPLDDESHRTTPLSKTRFEPGTRRRPALTLSHYAARWQSALVLSRSPRAGWRMGWIETVERLVAKLTPPPTVLILGSGLWGALNNESFAAALEAAARRAAPRVLWKTTTRMRNAGDSKWRRTDLVARRTFREVYDTAYLTRGSSAADYWDPRHFLPHVYNRLNVALLWQLYGKPRGCLSFNKGRCSSHADVSSTVAGGVTPMSARAASQAQQQWGNATSRVK